jgi:ribosomal protein S8
MSFSQLQNLCNCLTRTVSLGQKRVAVPGTRQNLAIVQILHRHDLVTSIDLGNRQRPREDYIPSSPDNISQRYWLDLKYYDNGKPALIRIAPISRKSRRVNARCPELRRLLDGKRHDMLSPLIDGEFLILRTNDGILDIYQALKKNIGGEVLCRVTRRFDETVKDKDHDPLIGY